MSVQSESLRRSDHRKVVWLQPLKLAALAATALVLVPLLVVLSSWGSDQTDIWQHLVATQLPDLLRNTLVLMFGVGAMVLLMGVGLAWLVVMYEFPGRAWFEWLLVLPLAMPGYVLAFVVLGIFDYSGPVQSLMSGLMGPQWSMWDVRSEFTVVVVLSLVLYPYVYMLARSAFLAQSSDTVEAARVLGCNRRQAFWRVALPMARPAIVAGLALALMETLADFGTVAVFNYDTFTTAIYKVWFGFFSLQAAAQLASLLLLFVGLTLYAERQTRGRRQYIQSGRPQHRFRTSLKPLARWCAVLACTLVILVAFLLPAIQLLVWVIEAGSGQLNGRYLAILSHSQELAGMAALLTVVIAGVLAFSRRSSSGWTATFLSLSQLGYALPGSVLAVGVMLSFVWLDRHVVAAVQLALNLPKEQWLVGGLFSLLVAYWVRFLAVASGPIEAGLGQIKASIPEAARTLGVSGRALLWRVYLPILRPGLLTALVLVFVDVMKEMPATLLLRPFGWDTLAVRIYELTSEGEWEQAALPALTLLLLGLVPVILSVKRSQS